MAIVQDFAETIKEELEKYVNPNLEEQIQLGDYGLLNGYIFQRIGNVKQLGIDFLVKNHDPNDPKGQKLFVSNSAIDSTVTNVLNNDIIKVDVEISFTDSYQYYINIQNTFLDNIDDLNKLYQDILKLWKNDKWSSSYVVVTERINADLVLAAMSRNSNSKFSLGFEYLLQSNIKNDFKIGSSSQTNLNYIMTKQNCVALIGLSKLRRNFPWFGEPEFEILAFARDEFGDKQSYLNA